MKYSPRLSSFSVHYMLNIVHKNYLLYESCGPDSFVCLNVLIPESLKLPRIRRQTLCLEIFFHYFQPKFVERNLRICGARVVMEHVHLKGNISVSVPAFYVKFTMQIYCVSGTHHFTTPLPS